MTAFRELYPQAQSLRIDTAIADAEIRELEQLAAREWACSVKLARANRARLYQLAEDLNEVWSEAQGPVERCRWECRLALVKAELARGDVPQDGVANIAN